MFDCGCARLGTGFYDVAKVGIHLSVLFRFDPLDVRLELESDQLVGINSLVVRVNADVAEERSEPTLFVKRLVSVEEQFEVLSVQTLFV